jgi:hypothetical protein
MVVSAFQTLLVFNPLSIHVLVRFGDVYSRYYAGEKPISQLTRLRLPNNFNFPHQNGFFKPLEQTNAPPSTVQTRWIRFKLYQLEPET